MDEIGVGVGVGVKGGLLVCGQRGKRCQLLVVLSCVGLKEKKRPNLVLQI